MMAYVAKYIAKIADGLNEIGEGEYGLYIGKVEIKLEGELIGYLHDPDGLDSWEFVPTEML